MPLIYRYAIYFVVLIPCMFMSSVAFAESLRDALSSAYSYNPELKAEQARLRSIDEGVAQAQSGYRPQVIVNGEAGSQRTRTEPGSFADGRSSPYGYSVTLNQPLFRGFRTINSIRQAKAGVYAGRASLRNVEQDVLLQAVSAYMNVVRDLAILKLRENNIKVLTKQLKATQDRFSVGEVTTTDVAQARARRSAAVSELNLARANYKTSQAEYRRIIGHQPRRLRKPGTILKYLPKSQNSAEDIGLSEHPQIEAAVFQEKSARHNVNVIRGERLPEINLEAQHLQNFDGSPITDETEVNSITARATIPLYQGGEVYARIRQAKQIVAQRRAELNQARVLIRATVVSAWGQLIAARAQIVANRVAVRANRTALSGVREEEKVGQRTILDVLDAEQELLDSQVNLVTAERDLVIAEYNLLSAIGRLSVATLPLTSVAYDPVENYATADRRWRGGDINDPDIDERSILHWDDIQIHRDPVK